MQSAGTIGQGDIAAANAQMQGVTNLMNMGTYLAGMALGGGGAYGGFGGGGGGGAGAMKFGGQSGWGTAGSGGLPYPIFG